MRETKPALVKYFICLIKYTWLHLVTFSEGAILSFNHTDWATFTRRYNTEGRCFPQFKDFKGHLRHPENQLTEYTVSINTERLYHWYLLEKLVASGTVGIVYRP